MSVATSAIERLQDVATEPRLDICDAKTIKPHGIDSGSM